jgi:hypothetical protein
MKKMFVLFVAIVVLLIGFGQAQATNISAQTDIWLASQPTSTSITGYWGTDTAPANSPVLVSVTAGNILTFSASGTTSVDGSCFAGADGGCYPDESGFSPAPASNTYKGPADALIGVFLTNAVTNVANGPASLDYTQLTNISQLTYTPLLNQIFFIGDGLTGTGTGSIQQFVAPTGATSLYLAVADSYGASTGNLGSLDVAVTSSVPEPATMLLLGLGLIGVAGSQREGFRTNETHKRLKLQKGRVRNGPAFFCALQLVIIGIISSRKLRTRRYKQ